MRRGRSRGTRLDAFAGKTALITGGASGIGRAIGAQLVAHGAKVILADIDGQAGERAVSELAATAASADSIEYRRLDVCDEAAFRSLVDQVAERSCGDV